MTYISNLSVLKNRRSDLRKNQTQAEKAVWERIKNRQLNNLKFRRQHGFGPYIVDFYCKELGLVIELDGDAHSSSIAQQYDKQRTVYLNGLGLKVLRFKNDEVLNQIDGVLDKITKTPPSLPFKKGRS